MTDPSPPTPGPVAPPRRAAPSPSGPRRRRPSFKVTILAAAAGFLVVFELLAYQLRSGHDPALSSGPVTAQVRPASAGAGPQHAPASGAVATRTSGSSAAPASGTAQAGATPIASPAPIAHHSRHGISTRTSGGGQSRQGDDGYEHEGSA